MKKALLTLCLATPGLQAMEGQANPKNTTAIAQTRNTTLGAIKPLELWKGLPIELKRFVKQLNGETTTDQAYLENYDPKTWINDRYLEKLPMPDAGQITLKIENVNLPVIGQPPAICNRHKLIAFARHTPLENNGSQPLYICDFDGNLIETVQLTPNESRMPTHPLIPYAFSEDGTIIVLMEQIENDKQLAHIYFRDTKTLTSVLDYPLSYSTGNFVPLSLENLLRVWITPNNKIFFFNGSSLACIPNPANDTGALIDSSVLIDYSAKQFNELIWEPQLDFFTFEKDSRIVLLARTKQKDENNAGETVSTIYIDYPADYDEGTSVTTARVNLDGTENTIYQNIISKVITTPIGNNHCNRYAFGCKNPEADLFEEIDAEFSTSPSPLQPTTHKIWYEASHQKNSVLTNLCSQPTSQVKPDLLESLTERDIRVINYLDGIYRSNEFEQLEKLDEQELHWLAMAFTFLPNYTREQFLQMIPNLREILRKGLFFNLTEAEQQEKIKHFSSLPAFIEEGIAKSLPERIAQIVLQGKKRKEIENTELEQASKKSK